MLSSAIAAILGRPRDEAFEDYYSRLMANDPRVAPIAREARQEYLARLQAQARLNTILM